LTTGYPTDRIIIHRQRRIHERYLPRPARRCESNITKEFSFKAVDRPLTEKGRLQAEQTAERFADVPIDEIYCSPLKRAAETADAIGRRLGIAPIPIEEFREVNVGSLELTPPTKETWDVYLTTTDS
jgi:probable phosphoglycerate mutase